MWENPCPVFKVPLVRIAPIPLLHNILSTYGHTLVLFTSYHLMGNVYQMLRDEIPFPMIEVWRHSPEEITRFKQMDNAVLSACLEQSLPEYNLSGWHIPSSVLH